MAGTANSGGRNAKSRRLHVLQGTFQPVRHAGHETPEPPPGLPTPPGPLSVTAKAEWVRMVARMELCGTLSSVDDGPMFQYVKLFAETEGIDEDCAENRRLVKALMRTVRTLEGTDLVDAVREIVKLRYLVMKNTRDLRQGHMAIRGYLVEFGMTPAARTRVKLPPTKPKSKLDELMGTAGA